MKYFIDTEFLEGTQKTLFGKTKPTIDLISIGIKCEDGREYYAISKDFNLKEAWNRCDVTRAGFTNSGMTPAYEKVYWIRDNVLKSIYLELMFGDSLKRTDEYFTYSAFNKLINKYGKTNKQISEEIVKFTGVNTCFKNVTYNQAKSNPEIFGIVRPQFYGYYSDYDWVVFCWLFGKMIDLPKGFPMYCIDLKQTLGEKWNKSFAPKNQPLYRNISGIVLRDIKNHPKYPKQTNEHNALADARWNFELYKFLQDL